jgi:hypothetical protein
MAGEQPLARDYIRVEPYVRGSSWVMLNLVSLLLLLIESQGSGATLGSLDFCGPAEVRV